MKKDIFTFARSNDKNYSSFAFMRVKFSEFVAEPFQWLQVLIGRGVSGGGRRGYRLKCIKIVPSAAQHVRVKFLLSFACPPTFCIHRCVFYLCKLRLFYNLKPNTGKRSVNIFANTFRRLQHCDFHGSACRACLLCTQITHIFCGPYP